MRGKEGPRVRSQDSAGAEPGEPACYSRALGVYLEGSGKGRCGAAPGENPPHSQPCSEVVRPAMC